MFARRSFAAFALPCSFGLRMFGQSAHCDEDKIIHQPSFRAHNTRSLPKRAISNQNNVTLDSMTLISGTAHKELAEKIAKEIDVPLCDASISRFADGEVAVRINDNIRGNDVFIIQTCSAPVNDSIMELLLMVSCARRSNVRRVIAVIPYFGYKHHRRGNAISTKHNSRFLWSGAGDFAAMLQEMGVDQVITVDLQRPGQGLESSFFDNTIPVETLISTDLFIDYFTHQVNLSQPITVVAPNAECFNKARKFQAQLQKHYKREVKMVAFFAMDTGSGPSDAEQLKTFNQVYFLVFFLLHFLIQMFFVSVSWKLPTVMLSLSMIWWIALALFNLCLIVLRKLAQKIYISQRRMACLQIMRWSSSTVLQ